MRVQRALLAVALVLTAPAFAATHTVNVVGLAFEPASLTIAEGDTVTWNFQSYPHTSTSDATSGPDSWDSGIVSMGGTFSHTFVTLGEHEYYCAVHSSPDGTMMNGVVTVEAAAVAPDLVAVSPSTGNIGGGTLVTLTGTSFTAECTASFGGTAAATGFVDEMTLEATTPAHAAGAVDVVVACPAGTDTLASGFTYVPDTTPLLAAVDPDSGPASGGTLVTLIGSNFESGCSVTFGSRAATSVTFVNGSTLRAVTPAHDEGTVDVSVSCPDGGDTLAASYTFAAAPADAAAVPAVSPAMLLLLAAMLASAGVLLSRG
jgi:plastocyanin